MPFRHSRAACGLTVGVLTLALTGCSAEAARPPTSAPGASRRDVASAAKPAPSRSASPSEAPTLAGSPSPGPTTTTSTPTSTQAVPGSASGTRLEQRLLSAEDIPGFNDGFTWGEAGTRRREGSSLFGTCHRFAMTSIGAMRVVVREYAPTQGADADSAAELVAQFPDQRTARRAFEVLRSWRGQCDDRLATYDRHRVGDLQHLDVTNGDAGWYLLTYGPPSGGSQDEGWFDSQGLTRVGSRIAVLRMRLVGQDFNYPAGEEPMAEAVRRAAVGLG